MIETFTMIGCARAAAELARMGHYDEARTLMTEVNRIKTDRVTRREVENGSHSLL
jgi:hypothetical protein